MVTEDKAVPRGSEWHTRDARHGANELPAKTQRGFWTLLVDQFSDFMILVARRRCRCCSSRSAWPWRPFPRPCRWCVTVLLALGARRMVSVNALVRSLPSVETLGSVTYICSEKTGTLTQNRMQAQWLQVDPEAGAASWEQDTGPAPGAAFAELLRAAVLCNDVTRGADGPAAIDQAQWLARANALAARGLRVLALALARRDHRELPAQGDAGDTVESELQLIGLIGLIDPPRPEAAAAVAECKAAGITPVMITGDHPAAARAIALALGIVDDEQAPVLTGADLATLDDDALSGRVVHTRVYARVDPQQKIRIVEALQARGEFVAMTGDGVNDAPALKRADIGVAMGKGGTDVAREAASLVLMDDNFATIVGAVREGRRIYDNIRKFVRYAMT